MKQRWTLAQRMELARKGFGQTWRNSLIGSFMVLLAAAAAHFLHLTSWETIVLVITAGSLGSGPIGSLILRRLGKESRQANQEKQANLR